MMTCFTLLAITFSAPIPAVNAEALKKEQDAAWTDLLKEEQSATKALFKFSNRPVESVAFFKSKLKTLIIDEVTVKKLIGDLASEDNKVWKPAFETLEYLDPRLAMPLGKAFDESKPGIGRLRLSEILLDMKTNLDFKENHITNELTKHENNYSLQVGNTGYYVEHEIKNLTAQHYHKRQWFRILRTIALLEHFGTINSILVLKTMTEGNAQAMPTVAAKESLMRLNAIQNAEVLKKKQDAAWADLLKDEPVAVHALFNFSNRPVESIAYFKSKLKPLSMDKATAKKFIRELGSEDDKVWKPAFKTFEYFDPRLALSLEQIIEESKTVLGQKRLAVLFTNMSLESFQIIYGDNPVKLSSKNGHYSIEIGNNICFYIQSELRQLTDQFWLNKIEWVRVLRVTLLLEHIGTTDAIAMLKSMATGHADASPTVAAKESLKRLKAE